MLREYVIGEAMHALGIPTTRALAVVATGESVVRETVLPGAVLTRVAASHLRVGTFQFAAAHREPAVLRHLADYAIARHHPEAREADHPYLALFEAVVEVQAALVARWMLVGFIHGVMNTDNVTISGETIDYGPCAFMEAYDLRTVFSSIDHGGRYAYGNQPAIAQWDLARLAETLLPLFDDDQRARHRPGDGACSCASATATSATGAVGCGPSSACPTTRRRRPDRRLPDAPGRAAGRLHVGLPGAVERRARRPPTSPARSSPTRRPSTPGPLAPPPPGRDRSVTRRRSPTPWTASTRSTSRATTWWRTPRPRRRPATSVRSSGSSKCWPHPFDERAGLEAHAAPAPPDFGRYRTFCGT